MRFCIGKIPIDVITNEEEAISQIMDIINNTTKVSFITTLNPEIAYRAEIDRRIRTIVSSSTLSLIDGIGIAKLIYWKTGIKARRITGVDTIRKLLLQLNYSIPVYLFGARETVLSTVLDTLKKENPNLNIVGFSHGYQSWDIVAKDIENKKPRLLLVALGAGRQEKFMFYYIRNLKFPIVTIGVGGSFDVWSGTVQRAPQIIQQMGMEWLWRNIKEPSRIGRLSLSVLYMILAMKKEVLYCEK